MKKTNKTFKRFAAITSASLLAACAMAPVFTSMTSYAATAGKITFKNGENTETTNTYNAYKIFNGTAQKNGFGGKAVLANVEWNASEEDVASILTSLKTDELLKADFADCSSANDVAEVLAGYSYDSEKAIAFAEVMMANAAKFGTPATSSNGEISLPDDANDGYYVIAQTTRTGFTTAYLLGVYDNNEGADVNIKIEAPTFEKKIMDANDTTPVANEPWQDSADYDIGDMVPFKLIATLPANYADYNEYMLIFHDNLEDTFTYSESLEGYITPKLYVDGVEVETTSEQFLVREKTCEGECNLEFVVDDVKAFEDAAAGKTVEVVFYAQLNENAKIGTEGNWNEAYLEYSNNPYFTSTKDSNGTIDNDGDGSTTDTDDETESTSETLKDKVVAFTYQTVIDKITEDGTALKGATFKLEKKVPKTEGDGYDLVTITQVEATPTSTFTFKGIDDGDYVLTEVSTPGAQYNSIAPIEFTISATHDENSATPTLTELKANVTKGNATLNASLSGGEITKTNGEKHVAVSGEIYTEIINSTGLELPGTGGIGTTIFYLGGGAMAAIGGIYLISKRRMRKSEE